MQKRAPHDVYQIAHVCTYPRPGYFVTYNSWFKALQNKRRKPVSGALVDLSSLSSALKEAASSDAAKAEEKAKPKGLGVGGARHRMRIK